MEFYYIRTPEMGVNSYFLVNDKTRNAIVIDGAQDIYELRQAEKKYNFKIVAEILTHAHFDHAGNAKELQDDGVKIYISRIDAPKLKNEQNLSSHFRMIFNKLEPDFTFSDGDILEIEGIRIKVIATPGHTDGSVCFLVEDKLFTGDTLFFMGTGRTDFPTGDYFEMQKSLAKLFSLDGDCKVYPGHEEFTTLDEERRYFGYKKC